MITPTHVAGATDAQLVCITYELFLEAIKDKNIKQAKKILNVLTENLNFGVELAHNLFNLYVYIQNILINHYKEESKLEEAYELIEMIYKGYIEIAKDSEEVANTMVNTQTVYAGMTYGKGYLNEIMVESPDRGFKA